MATDLPVDPKEIDWGFIEEQEGHQYLDGYIPSKNGHPIGRSGVTIATGVDLGQRKMEDLLYLELPPALIKKLSPYLWLKGNEAWETLKKKPLKLDLEEAILLDRQVKVRTSQRLRYFWGKRSKRPFHDLPSPVQTVLMSLAYNFGEALHVTLPDTFSTAVKCAAINEWYMLHQCLRNFPSKNPELAARREREADLLEPLVKV